MKKRLRIVGILFAVGIAMLSTGAANALASKTDSTQAANQETPPPIVEEFHYPGGEQIFSERGIRLIKGDGHIMLTDCDTGADVIKVESVTVGTSCYAVTGERGWLTMEIPRVYLLRGDGHNVAARITVDGQTEAVDLAPGQHTPVGESQGSDPATLIELHAS
ncbi:hypothetical protein ABZ863_22560 [Saccharomonospora sp. NPDC046836]|uniref:hypothetical protein n=1 Tax=Saccharomonospora sp. NPDC046836 TaxID=3156921 RepID=UPI0033C4DE95